MITFICGGVRSGKTRFAERLLLASSCKNLHYVATGVVTDEEMKERVTRHQQDRQRSERAWTTWEQPTDLHELAFSSSDAVLIDCLTTWVTNEMMKHEKIPPGKLAKGLSKRLGKLLQQPGDLVIVSNDVSRGMPSSFTMVRDYIYLLGQMNQWLVKHSDQAVEMVFGQPYFHKGVER
ncbi:bifunctional adenosylcobinamide kinase/adenosylcobinamide-phosphate guanylyltransferase [Halobacillus sp. A5]|uniref:bifunctional adenosylcobinamide kinase/adenosylcobinamide-phosphate guanylyltransferase n=1 Tax=Halobacillus sp. A5 TaxID=2880263 RepID=UPI0020A651C0|nr:bifunctional adenosylcobinamide kinase/adenosylcobinamide-phosphate guanylyltransferase [Halobacillus sp. A5]MCP3027866.1 bifunctional adenosylcobinamide kinase/adenosylcobinamide-phosphate guanylyltransferase [Halobacillus sp. A5]